ncbi:MAG: winged helix-turn-helix domain-containing protein [Caldilineaceae bacterium]|nr:winged helix-turn-helix domain-containing protein [Caldilineaceae bacterium]
MAVHDTSGYNAELEISESGRRYIILRYGRIFIAKLIEEMYTGEVFNALAVAYTAKFLSQPPTAVQTTDPTTVEDNRNRAVSRPAGRESKGATSFRDHTFAPREEEGTTEIPRRPELKLPILKLLARGPMEHRNIIEAVAEIYDLSEEERTRKVKSNLPIFEREVWGAKHLLKEEGLVGYPSRGEGRGPTYITERGLKFLEENS